MEREPIALQRGVSPLRFLLDEYCIDTIVAEILQVIQKSELPVNFYKHVVTLLSQEIEKIKNE